jgi:hypothetical protein
MTPSQDTISGLGRPAPPRAGAGNSGSVGILEIEQRCRHRLAEQIALRKTRPGVGDGFELACSLRHFSAAPEANIDSRHATALTASIKCFAKNGFFR